MFTHSGTTQDTTLAIKCRNEKKKSFQRALDCLKIDLSKLPLFKYFEWIYTACAYKKYVATWNEKSGGKCGKFSGKYPTNGRFYKTI